MKDVKEPLVIRRKSPMIVALLAIIIIVSWVWCWWWPHPVTTIYIARHAEKLNNLTDTPISAAGQTRANQLAHVLKDEGIDAVFVTQYMRTQQTGQPTATIAGVSVTQYTAGTPQDVVDAILANHVGKQILVIGHSNTLDDIASGLGAAGVSELAENQFDRLFVVHRMGWSAHLDRLRFGVETP